MTTTLPTAPSLRDLLTLGLDPAPYVGGVDTMQQIHDETVTVDATDPRRQEMTERLVALVQRRYLAGELTEADMTEVEWKVELGRDVALRGLLRAYLLEQLPHHPRAEQIADAGTWQALEVAALTALDAVRSLIDNETRRLIEQGSTALQTTESSRALDAVARLVDLVEGLP